MALRTLRPCVGSTGYDRAPVGVPEVQESVLGSATKATVEARIGKAGQGAARLGRMRQGSATQDKEPKSMRVAIAELESISPYSQSKHYDLPKLARPGGSVTETSKDYEERTWRERCHVDAAGHVFIPPMAFKNCLAEIAKYLSVQIPGKGKSTYTKHFEAGVMVLDGLPLPMTKDKVPGEWLFVPADGKRGSGKRVSKCFPVVPAWQGPVTFHILDDVISEPVFEQHLKDAGNFIGIGRFRPRNNGYYGRFKVNAVKWQ